MQANFTASWGRNAALRLGHSDCQAYSKGMKFRSSQPPYLTRHETLAQLLSRGVLQPHMDSASKNALSETCTQMAAFLPNARPKQKLLRYRYAELLSRQIEPDETKRLTVANRLIAAHDHRQCGLTAESSFENCRDLIWSSDTYLRRKSHTHQILDLTAPQRRDALGLLYAAKYDKTLQEGLKAADAARERDFEGLFDLLFKDAQTISLVLSSFACGGIMIGAGFVAFDASRTAWLAGGAANRTGSVALGGFGVASIAGGGLFLAAGCLIGLDHIQQTREERGRHMILQSGQDKVFCELITDRRNKGKPQVQWCQ